MAKFISENPDEILTTHSGLGLVGLILSKSNLSFQFSLLKIPEIRTISEIQNVDVIQSYIGILAQGKNDYKYIEAFRQDPFFPYALDIKGVPSSATVLQRLDQIANTDTWKSIILEGTVKMLTHFENTITPLTIMNEKKEEIQIVPLVIDVSPFDNSKKKKEGVSQMYKGCDVYALNFAYLRQEGYVVNTEIRTGSTHVQKGTAFFLQQSIEYAKQLSSNSLVVRMDEGNVASENLETFLNEKADFIIKRNPRREKPEAWLAI